MIIPVKGLAPLLQVFDMPASIAFYHNVLGFEVVASAGPSDDVGWVLLRLDRVELMLNTTYEKPDRPPAPDPARMAAHGDTAIYFACPNVDAVYRHLRAKGVTVKEPAIAPYGMKQLYVSDPDGYNLCFQWPATQQTRDQWRARYGLDPSEANDIAPGASSTPDVRNKAKCDHHG
jgi:catechol 2,3-dioxygenase-like lactoylglutathione lyase family enzyme